MSNNTINNNELPLQQLMEQLQQEVAELEGVLQEARVQEREKYSAYDNMRLGLDAQLNALPARERRAYRAERRDEWAAATEVVEVYMAQLARKAQALRDMVSGHDSLAGDQEGLAVGSNSQPVHDQVEHATDVSVEPDVADTAPTTAVVLEHNDEAAVGHHQVTIDLVADGQEGPSETSQSQIGAIAVAEKKEDQQPSGGFGGAVEQAELISTQSNSNKDSGLVAADIHSDVIVVDRISNDHNGNMEHKIIYGNRLPKDMPKFGGSAQGAIKSPREFIEQLELALECANYPPGKWGLVAASRCQVAAERQWVKSNVVGIDWQQAKKIFINHFDSPLERQNMYAKLLEAKQGATETVQQFSDRFMDILRNLGKLGNDEDDCMRFLHALKPELKVTVAGLVGIQPNAKSSINSLTLLASSIEATSLQNVIKAKNENQKTSIICHYCKKVGHKESQCRKKRYDNDRPKSNQPRPESKPKEKPKCFRCDSTDHLAKDCKVKFIRVNQQDNNNNQEKVNIDNDHKRKKFVVGDFIMAKDPIRSSKWDPIYEGPFKIEKINRGGALVVSDLSGNLLGRNVPKQMAKLVKVDQLEDVYEVKAVLNHRKLNDKFEYLTEWMHTDLKTWEPEDNFIDTRVIKQYWKNRESSNLGGGNVMDNTNVTETRTDTANQISL